MDEGGQKGYLLKICHKYPTVMNLGTVRPYLKKISLNNGTHVSCCISIFSQKISKLGYIKKYRCRFYCDTYFLILLTLFESFFIDVFNEHGFTFDDVNKNGYSRLS